MVGRRPIQKDWMRRRDDFDQGSPFGCGPAVFIGLFLAFVLLIAVSQFIRYQACRGMGADHHECIYRIFSPVYYEGEWYE